jgi:hypothetical protein
MYDSNTLNRAADNANKANQTLSESESVIGLALSVIVGSQAIILGYLAQVEERNERAVAEYNEELQIACEVVAE